MRLDQDRLGLAFGARGLRGVQRLDRPEQLELCRPPLPLHLPPLRRLALFLLLPTPLRLLCSLPFLLAPLSLALLGVPSTRTQ